VQVKVHPDLLKSKDHGLLTGLFGNVKDLAYKSKEDSLFAQEEFYVQTLVFNKIAFSYLTI